MRFYMDEDVGSDFLVSLLRARGHDVLTTVEAGKLGSDDESQLAFAASEGRVLVTGNIQHMRPIAEDRLSQGKHHAGVAFLQRRRTDQANGNRLLALALRFVEKPNLSDQLAFP
jgi:hypothetical protein